MNWIYLVTLVLSQNLIHGECPTGWWSDTDGKYCYHVSEPKLTFGQSQEVSNNHRNLIIECKSAVLLEFRWILGRIFNFGRGTISTVIIESRHYLLDWTDRFCHGRNMEMAGKSSRTFLYQLGIWSTWQWSRWRLCYHIWRQQFLPMAWCVMYWGLFCSMATFNTCIMSKKQFRSNNTKINNINQSCENNNS